MKKYAILLPCLALALFISCRKNDTCTECRPEHVSNVYSFLAEYNTMDSVSRQEKYIEDSAAVNAFMKTVTELPVNDDVLEALADSRVVEVFTPAVDSIFTDSGLTGRILGTILAKAKNEGIKIPERKYANVVYGRPESVLFVDSVMLIALNHYLGADYPGYSHWPTYIRESKTQENLPYDLAEALVATSYPYHPGDNATVLSRLLYEGALAHAKERVVNDGSTAMALGYSDMQLRWLMENEKDLWRSLVQNRLVYDTSESTIYKLIAPAPSVNILNPATPGRAGRFIGYRIVDSYMKKHPEATIVSLLSPDFYNSSSVLVESGY